MTNAELSALLDAINSAAKEGIIALPRTWVTPIIDILQPLRSGGRLEEVQQQSFAALLGKLGRYRAFTAELEAADMINAARFLELIDQRHAKFVRQISLIGTLAKMRDELSAHDKSRAALFDIMTWVAKDNSSLVARRLRNLIPTIRSLLKEATAGEYDAVSADYLTSLGL